MKYIILVPDGMAGEPLDELAGRTCLEAADKPNMDRIARSGIVGMTWNVPEKMTPASDVATLSILGYDPAKYYCGRGPLEAANMGIELGPSSVAFRFNWVTSDGGVMADYSAGHISTGEGMVLAERLSKELGSDRFKFYPGFSYRNIMVMNCKNKEEASKISKLRCYPPHDIMDRPIDKHFPDNQELSGLIKQSGEVLKNHEINKVRIDLGQNPANMIWLWGQGRTPDMPKFKDAYGLTGGIISAVDLIKGMGKILGLSVIDVPGATGYYDTNYEGKADAALEVLKDKDFVFVHVEAPDEAGHNGDIRAKITAIENFDSRLVARIMKGVSGRYPYKVMVLPDHPTPIKRRTHTADPVPFAIAGEGIQPDGVSVFTEAAAKAGSIDEKNGYKLMKFFLNTK
ncbi:MAG: cofactor-independent phosphoglycerate mutase [Candidatus Omnitrophica bacterium]|nr:cofactor-independent phosphoglycerate mutase [Candidatus Omnitrophota bacterium]